METEQIKTTLIEVLKTGAGAMAGRYGIIKGKEVLKVDEETDPKKKKLKEVGVSAVVTAIGIGGAIKVPQEYKSFLGGVAVSGVFGMATPFGKPDAGFLPVLHGAEEYEVYSDVNGLGQMSQEELDYQQMMRNEQAEETIDALAGDEDDDIYTDEDDDDVYTDEEPVNGAEEVDYADVN